MTGSDTPAAAGPAESTSDSRWLTADEGAEKLAALLNAAPKEILDTRKDKDQEADNEPEGEVEGNVENPDEAPDEDEGPDEAEKDETAEKASVELDDDAEFDLDGERIPFHELKRRAKRGQELQRDYSRKTEALAEDRRTVESKAQTVIERAQQLQAEREAFLSVTQEFIGQPPQEPTTSPSEDPIAWLEFQAAERAYNARLGKIREVYLQSEALKAKEREERQREMPKIVEQERSKLLERFPKLKDPEIARKTKTEMVDVFQREYGLSAEEVANVADSRVVAVMLDALEYRRLKAATPAVKAKIEAKPPLIKAAKRADPAQSANRQRQDLHAKLKKTGSRLDAVEILKSLDL